MDVGKRLMPDDFKLPLIEEAWRLRRAAQANMQRFELDELSAMWVIRIEAWREFMASSDFLPYIEVRQDRRRELMGFPVRTTIDDDPDTPMIQLVFEPTMKPRKTVA